MSMDRRQFGRAAGAGFVAFGIAPLFAACRNRREREEAAGPESGTPATPSSGPDRLILHVEDDAARSADLGRLVGMFLMHGDDEQLAPLATVELACATTAELAVLAPTSAARRDVRAVLDRAGRFPALAVTGDPPAMAFSLREMQSDERELEASVHERNAWLARQISGAIGTDLSELERRAAEESADGDDAALDSVPRAEAARRWPWRARLQAERSPSERAAWIAALAGVVRERWTFDSPAGSTWAERGGCGLRYAKLLHHPSAGIACGIGHTPEISRRFLHFYTAEERNG